MPTRLHKTCAFLASVNYRACGSVTDSSLTDHDMDMLVDWSDSIDIWGKFWSVLQRKKAGCCGAVRLTEWLLSARTIDAMVGLSAGSFWTHNKPMWMHLMASSIK